MFETIHATLTLLLLYTGAYIFIVSNPVYSVLFLILSFCNAAMILFLFKIEFLGLVFLMIYVGAVAVLFLFVIMMINTKTIKSTTLNFNKILVGLLLSLIFFFNLSFFINRSFFNINSKDLLITENNNLLNQIDFLSNTEILGQCLYNNYNIGVLIAGFILLIALIGSICLTLDFKKEVKPQNKDNRQLSRNFELLNYFN